MTNDKSAVLQQLGAMNDEQLELGKKRDELSAQRVQLEKDRAHIDADAAALEDRIRQLAKEEAEIQRRKREIQEEAKGVGNQRRALMERTKELSAEEGRIAQASTGLAERRTALEDQLEQAQKEQVQQEQEALELARVQEQAAAAPKPAAPPAPAPEQDGADKRTSKRIPVAVDVSMETPHNFYMGLTENLSEGGLFVATYDEVPMGTEVELKINLPGRPGIKATGIVRWVRELNQFTEDAVPGVGLEMVGLSDEEKQAIRDFLAQRDPIYYENFDES